MRKTKLFLFLSFLAVTLFYFSCAYCADENLTITTYYPSPYGSYRDLTVSGRMAIGDVNNDGTTDVGDFAVSSSAPFGPIQESLTIAGRLGIGTTTPNNLIQAKGLINFDDTKSNTFLGFNVGVNNTGINNVGVGYKALEGLTTGISNAALGSEALRMNTTGYNNTAVGGGALLFNLIGLNNTAVGLSALRANTASYNTAVGSGTLINNTTGERNTAIGCQALVRNTSGNANNAIGYHALWTNLTGAANIAIGDYALEKNTTGSYNIAMGANALVDNTTGWRNIALGDTSLADNIGGSGNIAIGETALRYNTSGINNIAMGQAALRANTGNSNVAVGYAALMQKISGASNTAIGSGAGSNLSGGNGNIAIGYYANLPLNNGSYQLSIGNVIYGTGLWNGASSDGKIGIGTSSPLYRLDVNGQVRSSAGVCTTSDVRWKKDILPIKDALNKIRSLEGVEFDWRTVEFPNNNLPKGRQIGLIAQEVEKVLPEIVLTDEKGYKSIEYQNLSAVLVEAIKEQQTQITKLSAANKKLEARVKALEK